MLHGLMCRTRFQRPLFRCSRQGEGRPRIGLSGHPPCAHATPHTVPVSGSLLPPKLCCKATTSTPHARYVALSCIHTKCPLLTAIRTNTLGTVSCWCSCTVHGRGSPCKWPFGVSRRVQVPTTLSCQSCPIWPYRRFAAHVRKCCARVNLICDTPCQATVRHCIIKLSCNTLCTMTGAHTCNMSCCARLPMIHSGSTAPTPSVTSRRRPTSQHLAQRLSQ